MFSRPNLLLGAIIFVAGYALFSLSLLATDRIWVPMFLPLALLGFLLSLGWSSLDRHESRPQEEVRRISILMLLLVIVLLTETERARVGTREERVLGGGLEPPCLSAYAPQTYVSAISPPERSAEN